MRSRSAALTPMDFSWLQAAFSADGNGNISSGITDINNTTTLSLSQTFSGTYSIGQDGLGFMMLNMTAGGSRTFALSMMANGNANIIEFDDSTGGFVNGSSRNSGVLLKQDTSARCPRLMAVTHLASWESTQARIVLAWQEFLARTERGILQWRSWIPMTAAPVSSAVPFIGAYTLHLQVVVRQLSGMPSYSFYVVKPTVTQPRSCLL